MALSQYPGQRRKTVRTPKPKPIYVRPDRPKPSREVPGPGRPARRKPLPFRPFHHKVKPFGPTPDPFQLEPVRPRRGPQLRRFKLAFPGLAAAGAFYAFYRWSQQQSAGFDLTGWTMYGSCTGRGMGPFIPNSVVCGPLVKTPASRGIQEQNLGATKRYRAMFLDQNAYVDELDRSIGQAAEWWEITLPAANPKPTIPVIAGKPEVWMQPGDWPAPEEWPQPQPQPQPQPKLDPVVGEPFPRVPLIPFSPPTIDLEVNGDGKTRVNPGFHKPQPPQPRERERKSSLRTNTQALQWMDALGKLVSGYTEMDDFIAALYAGLDWTVRRWRGRDGVWRDRHISTRDRLQSLYDNIGKLNLRKALDNVVKEGTVDVGAGALGRSVGDQVSKLGRKGLWKRPVGLQSGGRATKQAWDDMYAKLKARQGERVKAGRFTQWSKGADGTWRRKTVQRTKTFVAWRRVQGTRGYWTTAKRGTAEYWSRPQNRKVPYYVQRKRTFYR